MSSASGKDSSGDSGHEDWLRSGLNADSPSRPAPPPASAGRTAPPYRGEEASPDGAGSFRSRRAALVVALLLLVALLTIFVLILN
jgi:hypothetical protein